MNDKINKVVVIKDARDLEKIREDWVRLQWHPNADIDCFMNFIKIQKSVKMPYVLLVYENGAIESMLVGRIEDTKLSFNVGYKSVFEDNVRMLAVNYGGVLGKQSPQISELLIAELVKSLSDGDADIVFMNALRVDSDIYRLARTLPRTISRDRLENRSTHWKMACPENLDLFLKRMSQKHRYWIRRVTKLLEKEYSGKVEYKYLHEQKDIERLCEDAESIAKNTYQRGLGVGFRDGELTRQTLNLLATKRMLRSYFLYVNEKPCAYWIGTRYGNVFHLDYTAYDPAFQKNEPGTVLFMKMIDDLCRLNVKEIDFGFGDALYKNRYGDESWEESSVYIFSPKWKGAKLNVYWTLTGKIHQYSKDMAKKAQILQKIKTGWRRKIQHGSASGNKVDPGSGSIIRAGALPNWKN